MKQHILPVIMASIVVGCVIGWLSQYLAWYYMLIMVGFGCGFCCFFGMLNGYVIGNYHYRKIAACNQAMEQYLSQRMGRMGDLISSSAQAVADRVVIRMAQEIFKNADNDEHREAAIHHGAQIVEEEIEALKASIEEFK